MKKHANFAIHPTRKVIVSACVCDMIAYDKDAITR